MGAVLLLTMLLLLASCGGSGEEEATRLKAVAAALESRELYREAAEAWKRVGGLAELPIAERAQALYAAGNLLLDKENDARSALAAFTEASAIDPAQDFGGELARRTAAALERLGRGRDAIRIAAATASLDSASAAGGASAGGEVLAEVAGRQVTVGSLEREYGPLPADAEQRLALVRSHVARLLALDAARRDGLESDPRVEATMRSAQEAALSQIWLTQKLGPQSAPPTDSASRAAYAQKASAVLEGLLRDGVASGSVRILEDKVRAVVSMPASGSGGKR